MPYTNDSYIKRMEHTADTYERKAKRYWAEAKNGSPEDGYKYNEARKCYDRVTSCREKAQNARKRGGE